MVPHLNQLTTEESGIVRVIEAYFKHLPDFGVNLVDLPDKDGWGDIGTMEVDVLAVHAGAIMEGNVAHIHGLYWTADYNAALWEYEVNRRVIALCRGAREITVPSRWVAETFERDMRVSPTVVPHGIDVAEWEPGESLGYVLWNKNRAEDVCHPQPMASLAQLRPDVPFISTFSVTEPIPNVQVVGLKPHDTMADMVRHASVYLSTTKETFGIGTLEAMAAAVPVLGFAHGGNLDLVQHGVNGYLAKPGDMEDLARGLDYCLKYGETLGANGREIARSFTWASACEKVAKVYERAMYGPEPTAAIIIPSYNYADTVGRAIESAIKQDYKGLTEIIVVDDGSDDGDKLERVVQDFHSRDSRVRLLHKENGGVATARNAGIKSAQATYITCLDADDALEPEFLTDCIRELEADATLGIAYTKMRSIKPDGETGVSKWPDEFDYNAQLRRRNQIPTACVFRRAMWARLGGYKQRYAPDGAGAEDAEFWLRAGAYGFGAKLASRQPRFIYSWQSGRVSGNPDYKEVDWTVWHPWVKDEQHPFASLASPKRRSHPVRQYDEPVVSIIIPVGPGHADKVFQALDSLEAQTMREWEVVLVWDLGFGSDRPEINDLRRAYPYIREVDLFGGMTGPAGPGVARNRGATHARAPFVLFLDADDWLYPEALEKMLAGWGSEGSIIYTDYVGIATVSNPDELAPELAQHLYDWNEDTGRAVIGYRSADYDCARAVQEPLQSYQNGRPYMWCNVTALIPTSWHRDIGGFDETMSSWEDVDYHWRMAKAGHCYAHLPEELLVYRFDTGQRRATGLQDYPALLEYLRAKHGGIESVGCGCRGNGKVQQMTPPDLPGALPSETDSEFLLVEYTHPSRGSHMVVGPATRTRYGYRSGGEKFLVHRDDIRVQPDFFRPVEPKPVATAPEPAPEPPPEPSPLGPIVEEPEPPKPIHAPLVELGITDSQLTTLLDGGFETIDQIVEASMDELTAVHGIGAKTAQALKEKAEAWERS